MARSVKVVIEDECPKCVAEAKAVNAYDRMLSRTHSTADITACNGSGVIVRSTPLEPGVSFRVLDGQIWRLTEVEYETKPAVLRALERPDPITVWVDGGKVGD